MLINTVAVAVRLGLKLDKGKTYYERSVVERQITQEVMDKPVEQGDSWTRTRLTKLALPLISTTQSTLQKREAGVATIGSTSSLKSDPNGPPTETQDAANCPRPTGIAGIPRTSHSSAFSG